MRRILTSVVLLVLLFPALVHAADLCTISVERFPDRPYRISVSLKEGERHHFVSGVHRWTFRSWGLDTSIKPILSPLERRVCRLACLASVGDLLRRTRACCGSLHYFSLSGLQYGPRPARLGGWPWVEKSYTFVAEPQTNGVAERFNRTEIVCTLAYFGLKSGTMVSCQFDPIGLAFVQSDRSVISETPINNISFRFDGNQVYIKTVCKAKRLV